MWRPSVGYVLYSRSSLTELSLNLTVHLLNRTFDWESLC
jgi:hypothetical protein